MRIDITQRGRSRVNTDPASIEIIHKSENFVAAIIDLYSKWCEVGFRAWANFCGPDLWLEAGEDALYLDETKEGPTIINFPDYVGWVVFTAEVHRYSLHVCLYNPEGDSNED